MSLDPERTPVLVSAGQAESRDLSSAPLELAEAAAAEALGAAAGLADAVERLSVVNILSRRAGPTPASDLAKRLGITPARVETTSVGGNTPQLLVTRAAADIAAGSLGATLIAGAEAVRSGRLRAAAPPASPDGPGEPEHEAEPDGPGEPDPVYGTYRQDLSAGERAAGLLVPLHVYPLFESVLAARAGRSPEQQRVFLGELLARFTAVAAAEPHAWFRQARSPEEIAVPSAENRLVAEPYTKRMTAFLGGAQGAALVVTSLAVARRLGLEHGSVFVASAAAADDVWYPVARPDLGRSSGIEVAGRAALAAAGADIDDVAIFDLYSCFPSAVELGASALGVALDDPRGLTVTGGLPYFGGPGNNYSTHALAVMLERLRSGAARLGLVTALGWYATKHAVGLYSTFPPAAGFVEADTAEAQRHIDATALRVVDLGERLEAEAVVDASTVYYDREGRPVGAPVLAKLSDGRRVAAAAALDELPGAAGEWLVGARVGVIQHGDGAPARYRVIEARTDREQDKECEPNG